MTVYRSSGTVNENRVVYLSYLPRTKVRGKLYSDPDCVTLGSVTQWDHMKVIIITAFVFMVCT